MSEPCSESLRKFLRLSRELQPEKLFVLTLKTGINGRQSKAWRTKDTHAVVADFRRSQLVVLEILGTLIGS